MNLCSDEWILYIEKLTVNSKTLKQTKQLCEGKNIDGNSTFFMALKAICPFYNDQGNFLINFPIAFTMENSW